MATWIVFGEFVAAYPKKSLISCSSNIKGMTLSEYCKKIKPQLLVLTFPLQSRLNQKVIKKCYAFLHNIFKILCIYNKKECFLP